MSKYLIRPTSVGLALAKAAIKHDNNKKDNWVARRVQMNMEDTKLGTKAEPAWNAHLSKRTADHLKEVGVL